MRLFGSTRSPFARKVMLAAHELGLAQRIAFVPAVVSITQPDLAVVAHNPLGQIPTLVLDDGRVLPDSLLICEYLDGIADLPHRLFPQALEPRMEALARHAWGQGMAETLVRVFGERKRQADPLHPQYDGALRAKFRRVVDALEPQADGWQRGNNGMDIGDLAIASALAYADFRCAEERWRDGHARLAAWFAIMERRPSMQQTVFAVPAA